MHERKSFSQRVDAFLSGKGFYIVLFACVAVIGVSAWLLLFSQYSPLSLGDEGGYLDAMGDLDKKDPGDATGTGADVPKPTDKGTDKPTEGGKKETDEPVHGSDLPQEPNKPEGSGAITVQDDPKPDEPTENPNDKGEESGGGTAMTPEDVVFIWPVSGEVLTPHSPAALLYDKTMGDWRTHAGVDIASSLGTKVLSCANGTVTEVREDARYGTTVVIDHGAGVVSAYANLAGTPTVSVGDAVAMGSVIGSVGSTALYETGVDPHLHFTLTVNGESADPLEYLPEK